MKYELDRSYEFYAKVENVNQTDKFFNINVTLEDNSKINLKVFDDLLFNPSELYYFEIEVKENNDKIHLVVKNSINIFKKSLEKEELEAILKKFYKYAPIDLQEAKNEIETLINSISNHAIREITKDIYYKYQENFYLYPAALVFHHAYIGGLVHHTFTMLKMIPGFLAIYPFLQEDILISGIILHDICKVIEFKNFLGSDYTVEGQLIGHLVLGALEIEKSAQKLNIEASEEVLVLQHILISHHGQHNFGAAKKPLIAEALLIWYFDTIDSKFAVLGDELNKTKEGEYTNVINILDRLRFYKPKI